MYGNYDGLNSAQPNNPLQFDLYVDANYWMTLDIIDESSIDQPEVLTVALANFLSVCLVNTGSGTPFISLLELRTLNSSMYKFANATHSLSLQFRLSLGPKTGQIIRYPYDPYDLSWLTFSGSPIWTQLSTNLSINTSASFGAPSVVLQTAATPINSTALEIMIQEDDSSTKVFIVFYFAELVKLNASQLREFNIYFNGKNVYGPYSPSYLSSDAIYTTDFLTGIHNYSFLFNATESSTLPPLLNAIEVYSGMFLTEPLTERNEAEAMMSIKEQYQLKKNWMGDPCNPAKYSWQGVKCDYDGNNSTIVAVDLTGNNFSGPIPQGLLERAKEGSLDLRYQRTLKFTYKSDVYSFGIVLLKVLTAHSSTRGGPHIVEHVLSKLQGGNLDAIVDQRLHGGYSTKSVWRFVDLAMRCSAPSSSQRPTMAEVTMQLNECLDLEISHEMDGGNGGGDISQTASLPPPISTVKPKWLTYSASWDFHQWFLQDQRHAGLPTRSPEGYAVNAIRNLSD
ncbi:hypothetical protein LUZ62_048582 [Rhynchospora pubera]|uniref:Malectin-like domain-containing protein n=1 Tax=Rhynchospora pubera TaxID=906938 RepID=A0AAV8G275_9POAL|nr:hypothetical protein LUZ62_048582 [Rhynchospora pubera]